MSALYTHTTRGPGTILTSTIYNADHQNHIDNGVPNMLDDYSVNQSQCQSQVDPYPSSVLSLPTSLAGELERIRFALAEVKGTTYWYEDSNMRGWQHIQTITCGTLANVDFENGFSGTYKDMLFIFRDCLPGTADSNLVCRMKSGGAYIASNYDYHISLLAANAVGYNAAAASAGSSIIICPATDSSGTDAGMGGHMMLYNITGAFQKRVTFHTQAQDSGGVARASHGSGRTNITGTPQGVRFLWSSGNFSGGEISQYGMRAA